MVTPSYPPNVGGVEGHVSGLTRALAKTGADVTVLTQGTRSGRSMGPSGVQVITFPSIINGRIYKLAPTLGWWLAAHRGEFDLVHAHSYHAAAASIGALASGDLPLVLTPHYHGGGHTSWARFLHYGYRPLGTWLLNRATAVICVSEAEAVALGQREHAVRSRTAVVPNAPASSGLSAERPAPGPQLVLSLGRLVPYKHNRLLISGFRLLDNDAELVIAGDGPERPTLEADARADRRVHVVGQVERSALDQLLLRAWVVASLSQYEAFGMALLEGLLAGARVVASDIPSHREVLELCAAEDHAELLRLPASPATVAAGLGKALREGPPTRAVRGWSWDDVAQRTLEVYDQVLVRSPRPGMSGPLRVGKTR